MITGSTRRFDMPTIFSAILKATAELTPKDDESIPPSTR